MAQFDETQHPRGAAGKFTTKTMTEHTDGIDADLGTPTTGVAVTPVEYSDGTREWRVDGQLHREDGPAIERPDGHLEWHFDGQLHRTDGPAIEYADGSRMWYSDGQLHREDGPAIERPDGHCEWRVCGKLHREVLELGSEEAGGRISHLEVFGRVVGAEHHHYRRADVVAPVLGRLSEAKLTSVTTGDERYSARGLHVPGGASVGPDTMGWC